MGPETIGIALTGSFCTLSKTYTAIESLREEYAALIPIVSETVAQTDTKFGTHKSHLTRIEALCQHEILSTLPQIEPIGPNKLLDALIIMPCTGNTLAKLSHGIADSVVTFAAKAHLRNSRPIVLAISTNDALAAGLENIGRLLNRKQYYFVPFYQDSPEKKPFSLVSDLSLLPETLRRALLGQQIQPILC